MSRMTEALAKQAELDQLTGRDFKDAADKGGFAAIAELTPAHYKLIEALLANPRKSSVDLAAEFGYSGDYIARVRRAPCFIIEYESRVEDAYKQFRQGLVEKVAKSTADALLAISEVLTDSSGEVTTKEKLSAAKMLFEGDAFSLFKGAGAKEKPAALSVNINNTPPAKALGVTQDMLNAANTSMFDRFMPKEDIVDGEISTDSVKE